MPPKKKDDTIPPYTTESKGRFVYRPYDPETKKNGKEITLCKISEGKEKAWKIYFEVSRKPDGESFRQLLVEYYQSPEFKKLKPRTQKDYESYGDDLCAFKLQSGGLLGDAPYKMITAKFAKGLFVKLKTKGLRSAQVRIGFMKSVISWAFDNDKLDSNVLFELKLGKRTKSKVNNPPEIPDLQLAFKLAPAVIKAFIIIAIACRGRRIEALNLKKNQAKEIRHEGKTVQVIDYTRAKGSKDNFVIFSPQLADAWNWDKGKGRFSQWVLHKADGSQYTEYALKSAWARLMIEVENAGGKKFTMHSLKHLGVTLDTGDKVAGSGLTELMVRQVYDHSKKVVKSVI